MSLKMPRGRVSRESLVKLLSIHQPGALVEGQPSRLQERGRRRFCAACADWARTWPCPTATAAGEALRLRDELDEKRDNAAMAASGAIHSPYCEASDGRPCVRCQRDSAREALREYGEHSRDCLQGQAHQGRPTKDGGYETLYGFGPAGRWYPRGEKPPCSCGLGAALGESGEEGK